MNRYGAKSAGLGTLNGTTDIDLKISQVYIGRWISCTTNSFPSDIAGIMTEFEKLAQATTTLPTKTSVYNFGAGTPYSTKLVPLRSMDFLRNSKNAILRSINFYALDTTKSGSAYQHAATLSEIMNPSTANDEYIRTKYLRNELAVTWQPTFFNPEFLAGRTNILANVNSGTDATTSLGIGFGLPINFSDLYYKPERDWSANSAAFEVYGFCVQYIEATSMYQRYPIICEAEFVV